jgi:hypothetical protein
VTPQPAQTKDVDTIENSLMRHRTEIAWGVLVPAIAVVITVATFGHGVYVGLLDRISTLDRVVAANSAHRIEHEADAERWITEIVSHRERLFDVERAVGQLRREPDARPDPYTGTDAKRFATELERRFRALEQRVNGDDG